MKRFLTLLAFVITTICSYAYDCEVDGIYYDLSGNEASVTRGETLYTSSKVVIPEKITYNGNTYLVTSIGNGAFRGTYYVGSVTIPNSVTSIGDYAFSGSQHLYDISLPNTVTNIGDYAFSGSQVTSIPNSLISIGKGAFRNCSKLTSITIPSSVTSVGENPFEGCSNVTELIYAEGIEKVFRTGLTSITSVVIPNSAKSIEEYAFLNCTNLTSVTIPNSVTSIGFGSFWECSSLASVTIGSSVTNIGTYAFWQCTSLTTVNIPSSVMSIDRAFSGCTSLPVIDNIRYADTYLVEAVDKNCTSVHIKEGTRFINEHAFDGCSYLTSISIPNSVTSIENCTFKGCSSLISISIPNSVTSIEYSAFESCSSLRDVYCEAETVPATALTAFGSKTQYIKSATLHVPAASLNAYKSTAPWNQFNKILCIGGEYLTDGEVFDNQMQKECPELTYTRTFSETLVGKWSALYVPFSFNVEDYLEDFDIAEIYAVCPSKDTNGDGEINSNDANTLVINKKKTGTTLPNIPYLIRPKEAKTYIITSADNVLYPAEENSITCSTTTDVYTFTGHYETTTAVGNKKYYMTTDGILDYSPSSPISIKPNRWIMSVESHGYGNSSAPSEARAISIKVIGEDDETNGIESIKADRNNGNIYNLNGVKMNSKNLPAGIYIKNGKKIVVK